MNSTQRKTLAIGILLLFLIGTILPNISANTIKNSKPEPSLSFQSGNYEYIIITARYFQNSYFQQLLDHKSQFLTTKMVFVEDILMIHKLVFVIFVDMQETYGTQNMSFLEGILSLSLLENFELMKLGGMEALPQCGRLQIFYLNVDVCKY